MSWGVCIWGTCCDNSHSDASLKCSDSRLDHRLRTQVWRLSTAISMYLLVRTNYFVVIVFSSIHEAFYMQRIITSNSSRYWELPDSNDGVRTEAPASEKGVHSDDWISSVYRSCLTTNTVSEGWVCYTLWSIKYHFWPRHRTWGWAVCGLLIPVWYGCIGMVFFVSLCCMLHATYILPLYYGYTQLQAVLDVLPLLQWFVYMVIAPQISVFVQKQGMKRNRIWNPLLASCWGICVIFTFFRLCNDKKVARCQWRETLHFTLYTKHHSNMCAWSKHCFPPP